MDDSKEDAKKVPPGFLLSISAGGARRQAPLVPRQRSVAQPGISPVVSETEAEQAAQPSMGPMSVARKVRPTASQGKESSRQAANALAVVRPSPPQTSEDEAPPAVSKAHAKSKRKHIEAKLAPKSASRRHHNALEARSYLEDHNILPFVERMLRTLVQDRPNNPWSCIAGMLPEGTKLPEDIVEFVKLEQQGVYVDLDDPAGAKRPFHLRPSVGTWLVKKPASKALAALLAEAAQKEQTVEQARPGSRQRAARVLLSGADSGKLDTCLQKAFSSSEQMATAGGSAVADEVSVQAGTAAAAGKVLDDEIPEAIEKFADDIPTNEEPPVVEEAIVEVPEIGDHAEQDIEEAIEVVAEPAAVDDIPEDVEEAIEVPADPEEAPALEVAEEIEIAPHVDVADDIEISPQTKVEEEPPKVHDEEIHVAADHEEDAALVGAAVAESSPADADTPLMEQIRQGTTPRHHSSSVGTWMLAKSPRSVQSQPVLAPSEAEALAEAKAQAEAAIVVDFRYSNLDFGKVMASPLISAALTKQIAEAISCCVRVPTTCVEVDLIPGSIVVNSTIYCAQSDAAQLVMKTIQTDAEGFLQTIDSFSRKIPYIEDAITDFSNTLALDSLKVRIDQRKPLQGSTAPAFATASTAFPDSELDITQAPTLMDTSIPEMEQSNLLGDITISPENASELVSGPPSFCHRPSSATWLTRLRPGQSMPSPAGSNFNVTEEGFFPASAATLPGVEEVPESAPGEETDAPQQRPEAWQLQPSTGTWLVKPSTPPATKPVELGSTSESSAAVSFGGTAVADPVSVEQFTAVRPPWNKRPSCGTWLMHKPRIAEESEPAPAKTLQQDVAATAQEQAPVVTPQQDVAAQAQEQVPTVTPQQAVAATARPWQQRPSCGTWLMRKPKPAETSADDAAVASFFMGAVLPPLALDELVPSHYSSPMLSGVNADGASTPPAAPTQFILAPPTVATLSGTAVADEISAGDMDVASQPIPLSPKTWVDDQLSENSKDPVAVVKVEFMFEHLDYDKVASRQEVFDGLKSQIAVGLARKLNVRSNTIAVELSKGSIKAVVSIFCRDASAAEDLKMAVDKDPNSLMQEMSANASQVPGIEECSEQGKSDPDALVVGGFLTNAMLVPPDVSVISVASGSIAEGVAKGMVAEARAGFSDSEAVASGLASSSGDKSQAQQVVVSSHGDSSLARGATAAVMSQAHAGLAGSEVVASGVAASSLGGSEVAKDVSAFVMSQARADVTDSEAMASGTVTSSGNASSAVAQGVAADIMSEAQAGLAASDNVAAGTVTPSAQPSRSQMVSASSSHGGTLVAQGATAAAIAEAQAALGGSEAVASGIVTPSAQASRSQMVSASSHGGTLVAQGATAAVISEAQAGLAGSDVVASGLVTPSAQASRSQMVSASSHGGTLVAQGATAAVISEAQAGLAGSDVVASGIVTPSAQPSRSQMVSASSSHGGALLVAQGATAAAIAEAQAALAGSEVGASGIVTPSAQPSRSQMVSASSSHGGALVAQGATAAAIAEAQAALAGSDVVASGIVTPSAQASRSQMVSASSHGGTLMAQGATAAVISGAQAGLAASESVASGLITPSAQPSRSQMVSASSTHGGTLVAQGATAAVISEAQAALAGSEVDASGIVTPSAQPSRSQMVSASSSHGGTLVAQGATAAMISEAQAALEGSDVVASGAVTSSGNASRAQMVSASSRGGSLMAQGATAAIVSGAQAGLAASETVASGIVTPSAHPSRSQMVSASSHGGTLVAQGATAAAISEAQAGLAGSEVDASGMITPSGPASLAQQPVPSSHGDSELAKGVTTNFLLQGHAGLADSEPMASGTVTSFAGSAQQVDKKSQPSGVPAQQTQPQQPQESVGSVTADFVDRASDLSGVGSAAADLIRNVVDVDVETSVSVGTVTGTMVSVAPSAVAATHTGTVVEQLEPIAPAGGTVVADAISIDDPVQKMRQAVAANLAQAASSGKLAQELKARAEPPSAAQPAEASLVDSASVGGGVASLASQAPAPAVPAASSLVSASAGIAGSVVAQAVQDAQDDMFARSSLADAPSTVTSQAQDQVPVTPYYQQNDDGSLSVVYSPVATGPLSPEEVFAADAEEKADLVVAGDMVTDAFGFALSDHGAESSIGVEMNSDVISTPTSVRIDTNQLVTGALSDADAASAINVDMCSDVVSAPVSVRAKSASVVPASEPGSATRPQVAASATADARSGVASDPSSASRPPVAPTTGDARSGVVSDPSSASRPQVAPTTTDGARSGVASEPGSAPGLQVAATTADDARSGFSSGANAHPAVSRLQDAPLATGRSDDVESALSSGRSMASQMIRSSVAQAEADVSEEGTDKEIVLQFPSMSGSALVAQTQGIIDAARVSPPPSSRFGRPVDPLFPMQGEADRVSIVSSHPGQAPADRVSVVSSSHQGQGQADRVSIVPSTPGQGPADRVSTVSSHPDQVQADRVSIASSSHRGPVAPLFPSQGEADRVSTVSSSPPASFAWAFCKRRARLVERAVSEARSEGGVQSDYDRRSGTEEVPAQWPALVASSRPSSSSSVPTSFASGGEMPLIGGYLARAGEALASISENLESLQIRQTVAASAADGLDSDAFAFKSCLCADLDSHVALRPVDQWVEDLASYLRVTRAALDRIKCAHVIGPVGAAQLEEITALLTRLEALVKRHAGRSKLTRSLSQATFHQEREAIIEALSLWNDSSSSFSSAGLCSPIAIP